VGQALHDLGITHILASTPQAKGRIERLFETTAKPVRQASPSKEKAGSERKPHKPAANHPWRQYRNTTPIPRIPQQAKKVEPKPPKD
jgi:urease alpha subunit